MTTTCCEKEHCEKCGSLDYFASIQDAFWANCEWNGECLIWMGAITSRGYGVRSFKGRQWKAHRIARALAGTFVPHWLVIDHLCKKTGCVNPAHLEVVSNVENVMRGDSFGPKNKDATHCPKGHSYAEHGKMRSVRKGAKKGQTGWRICNECHKEKELIRKREMRKQHGK